MEITVLDTSYNSVAIVDVFESLIWTDRYAKPGDFEIFRPMDKDILTFIKQDYYIVQRDSEHGMIIEKILIASDTENGNHITVSGRSFESILDRRIIWGQKIVTGNLQNAIKTLITESIISPTISSRKIANFIFEDSTDPTITALTINAQYTGDNLLDVIEGLCDDNAIGFKVTLNESNQFVFKLYSGVDRSYDQTTNPYVIFSPSFENIINSNYIESKSALKTVTLVGGEGDGSARRYSTVGSGAGLNRRELFTDARDISSSVSSGVTLSDSDYIAQLQQRGSEKLSESIEVVSFEGKVDTTVMFTYSTDFFLGDIVQIANEYGHETKSRISEIVFSEDSSGVSVYPTFITL